MTAQTAPTPSPSAPLELRRRWRNVLVLGHRPNRLPADTRGIEQALADVLRQVKQIAESGGTQIRIVAGLEHGVDRMAAAAAASLGLPLHIAAVCPGEREAELPVRPERACYFTAECPASMPERWIAAMDEVKLDAADVIVIVWDGRAPEGTSGGSVRVLAEALRRRLPVIWIDAREASAGTLRLVEHGRLESWSLMLLEANERDVERMRHVFVDMEDDLAGALKHLLTVPWDQEPLQRFDRHLRDPALDPADRVVGAGAWHSHVFSWVTAGCWKRRKAGVLKPYRENADGKVVANSLLPPAVWDAFDRMDRAASHAANQHRDFVTLIYLAASLAVFAAVAGAICSGEFAKIFWGFAELVALGAIVFILRHDRKRALRTHGAWLLFRQAAEALRMSAILYPQLASLTDLQRAAWRVHGHPSRNPGKEVQRENVLNHWAVTQLLRDAGLPCQEPGKPYVLDAQRAQRREQLLSMLSDQIAFHRSSERRHQCLHKVLHRGAEGIFWLVLGVVVLHLAVALASGVGAWLEIPEGLEHALHALHGWDWLLLITAGFPALAAAVHGIQTTLEVERVADRSEDMVGQLRAMEKAVSEFTSRPDFDPMGLRALAQHTTKLMYREHSGWAELMQSQLLEGAV